MHKTLLRNLPAGELTSREFTRGVVLRSRLTMLFWIQTTRQPAGHGDLSRVRALGHLY